MQNNTVMTMFFAFFCLLVAAGAGYGGYRYGRAEVSLEVKDQVSRLEKELAEAKARPAAAEGGQKSAKTPFSPSSLTADALASVPGLSGLGGAEQEKALYILNNVQGACQPCMDTGRSLGQCYLDMSKLLDQKVCGNIPKLIKRVTSLADSGGSPDDIRAVVDLGTWIPISVTDAPSKGPKDAPIKIVEISDFQCPYCKKSQDTLHQLDAKYGNKIQWSFVNLPLQMHKMAGPAAKAAMAAHLQGKFWPFADALFASQAMDEQAIQGIATQLELNIPRWETDRASLPVDQAVQADMQRANKLGITSTPTFFVNGYKVKGAQPIDAFSRIIDAELADGG